MAKSCIYTPTVSENMREGEPSRLWKELLEYTGNRSTTIDIFSVYRAMKKDIDKHPGIEFYDNGEPTLESIIKVFGLHDILDDTSLKLEKIEIGAIDKSGERIYYDTLSEVLAKIKPYLNNDNKIVATPVKSVNGKYYIDVTAKYNSDSSFRNKRISGNEAHKKLQEAVFNDELSKRLFSFMNQLGFTVVYDDAVKTGIFDPKNAETLANGMKAVIRIAHGEQGEKSFIEEFSHFLLAGMINEPLVQRVLSRLDNEDILRVVLTEEQYQQYFEEYSNDMNEQGGNYNEAGEKLRERMRLEALGKLLAEEIKNNEIKVKDKITKSFISRIWNYIKAKFRNLTTNNIDNAISDARSEMGRLFNMVFEDYGKPYFDKDQMLNSDYLKQMVSNSDGMAKIAKDSWVKWAKKRKKHIEALKGVPTNEYLRELSAYNKLIAKEKYTESCSFFLYTAEKDLVRIDKRLKMWNDDILATAPKIEDGERSIPSLTTSQCLRLGSLLAQIIDYAEGYQSSINDMKMLPQMLKNGQINISETDAKRISDEAYKLSKMIEQALFNMKEMRFIVEYNFLKEVWGEDKIIDIGKNKGKKLTLAMIMEHGTRELGILDRFISSMGESHDALLNLYNESFKRIENESFTRMREFEMKVREAMEEYRLASGTTNTEFMYELDENGVPTGWLISDINFKKYYEDRDALIQALKDSDEKPYRIKALLDKWEQENTEEIEIGEKSMIIPKSSEKTDPYYIDRLSKLNEAQRRFYDKMIEIKKELESNLPYGKANLYFAVQIENSMLEVIDKGGSIKDMFHVAGSNATDMFVAREYDTEFGAVWDRDERSGNDSSKKMVRLNIKGDDIERSLPMYYTYPIKDKRRLSTDFVGSMMAYTASCITYGYMSKYVDIFELAKSMIADREVDKGTYLQSKKYEYISLLRSLRRYKKDLNDEEFERAYKTKGGNISKKYNDWMDMAIYKKYKNDEGSIKLPWTRKGKEVEVDIAKSLDVLKRYTGNLGLAINIFSASSNVLMGKIQMMTYIKNSRGWYTAADAARSMGLYYQLLPEYLGEICSTTKNSKLSLLIDEFDMLEEYYSEMRRQGKYSGAMGKIFHGKSLMFLNNAGEHLLHARTGITILLGYKVDVNGKETSLYDAFEKLEHKDDKGNILSTELVFKEGTKTKDGTILMTAKLTEEYRKLRDSKNKLTDTEKARLKELEEIKSKGQKYLNEVKGRINYVNGSLNGCFNENDRGTINRFALGRLAMQFRQWMPAHFSRRFKETYYNARMGEFAEGFYRTFGRFLWDIAADLRHGEFHLITNYKNLSQKEKLNVAQAFKEIGMFILLNFLCAIAGKWKDKDSSWTKRYVLYNLQRLRLEVGATTPWPPSISKNFFSIVKDPAAALRTSQNLIDIICLTDIFNSVESGTHKGESKWIRNVLRNVPVVNNVNRAIDFAEENYLFNALNQ